MNPVPDQLTLQLSLAEINQILTALGERPYSEVFQLIQKLRAQAEAQVSGPQDDSSSG